ncbi:hypothetical protein M427DRAFT_379076 [Gonapodya prolifera JEL478]|uniref:Uncharacterized protein n=1 Tax=Gonapodya prolifera (strain JEL478) TaxID=1344416 RepID=A0A139AV48_GONPJ|nr:hypothetical protein M427DRAFT_379076 [Gonapodya prolifera JEL478]|eukprot:KXS20598.1 hypothetical protein M427DRAFT_379076 [Gonapodya prolifera JEL478]
MSQRPLLKDDPSLDLNLPTSSADAQIRPNEFFPTRKAREFFAVPEGDPPNPAPRWILWFTAILYGVVIIGAAVGWFIYSFAFQNCGWKQQAYDPKLPTCSFRSGSGTSPEDPSSSGTVILPNAVTLK